MNLLPRDSDVSNYFYTIIKNGSSNKKWLSRGLVGMISKWKFIIVFHFNLLLFIKVYCPCKKDFTCHSLDVIFSFRHAQYKSRKSFRLYTCWKYNNRCIFFSRYVAKLIQYHNKSDNHIHTSKNNTNYKILLKCSFIVRW